MTVVVGFTPNKFGQAALAAGIKEAKLRGLPLLVFNATKGEALVDPRFATSSEVQTVSDHLTSLGLEHEVRQQVGSDIADQVLDVVAETNAELLVIGIRHRSPVGKMFMGSVAQRLLLDCPCPILAVKAPA